MDPTQHLNSIVRLGLLLCASFLNTWAQSEREASARPLEFRTLLFAAGVQQSAQASDQKAIAPDLPELYYFDGSEYRTVAYSHSGRSVAYPYMGPEEMKFFVRSTGAEGEWVYRPVFDVEVSKDWAEALIVLLPKYNREESWAAFAVNTTAEDFRSGTIRIYNLSPRNVILNANEKIFPLETLKPVEVDISGIERNLLPVALALKGDSEFELVYRRRWSMRNNIRGVYFLFTLNEDYRRWYMKNIIL